MNASADLMTAPVGGTGHPGPVPAVRRGACPSLDRPMRTGDGLLVRLTPCRGGLTLAIAQAVCELARRHGNGLLEISTRGNLQIRGLSDDSAAQLADKIDPLRDHFRFGLTVDADPLDPRDPNKNGIAKAIVERIEHEAEKTGLKQRLAPKFSMIVDAGGPADYSGLKADIRLRLLDTQRWAILIGGTEATGRHLGDLAPDEAAIAACVLAAVIATLGPDRRGRDMPAEQARDAISCVAPSFVPAVGDASPFRPADRQTVADVGALRLSGTMAAILSPAYGTMTADDLQSLIEAAASLTDATNASRIRIHTVPDRLLVVTGLSAHGAEALLGTAAAKRFIIRPDDPRRAIACCAGHPACASAHFDTHGLADLLVSHGLSGSREQPVHLSGCEKQCARPASAALHVVGTAAGVDCLDEAGTAIAQYTRPDDTLPLVLGLPRFEEGRP